MTKDQKRRVLESILECDAFIEKEEKRDPNLRPEKTATILEEYKNHRLKLINMIAAA